MTHLNYCGFDCSSTVTPAKAGAQHAVWLRNEGLGPGLRRGDGDGFENVHKNTNPSIHLPSQAKMPQTEIQMRGFKS
jgi:hypothetical protein